MPGDPLTTSVLVLRLITLDTDVFDLLKILLGITFSAKEKKTELKKVNFWASLCVKKRQKKGGRKTEIDFDIFYKN